MGRKELQDKEKFRSPFINVKCSSGEIKRKKRRVPSEDEDAYKGSVHKFS